jgi:large subunit ribosomal protein L25
MAILNAKARSDGGKGVARKLRKAGQIPAVTYGHGQDSRSLTVNAHELELLLATINPENTIIDLRIEGATPAMALIREIQRHPSRPFIQHLDLFQVKAGETIHVDVPIRLHGNPVGVRDMGGVMQEAMHELSVECLPKDIPSAVDIDVEALELGQSIHVSDIQIPNVTILNDPELVICTVATPSTVELPEPTVEAEAEPEVIRERKDADSE